MEYKHIKIHKDVWDVIVADAKKLDMKIIDYVRYLAYKIKAKG